MASLLTQEVGGAAGRVGPAFAQPRHQHVAGSGGNGQQRVIAPLAGIAVAARPPCPDRMSRRWWNQDQWSTDRSRVRPQWPRPGPATRGSPDPVGGYGPTGNCAGRSPGWTTPSPRSRWRQPSRRYATRRRRRCSRHQPAPMPPGSASCLPYSLDPSHLLGQRGFPPVYPVPGAGPASPEGSAQHWPPGGGHPRRFECGRGVPVVASYGCSSFRVGLSFQKPLSPKRGSTCFIPSAHRHTHLFGGLGIRDFRSTNQVLNDALELR